jgi:hypothetical protein
MVPSRTMPNFIVLPDATLLNLNGGGIGELYTQISLQGKLLTDLFFFQQAQLVLAWPIIRSDIHLLPTQF